MKINLISIEARGRGCVNKDLAGGMGTRTIIGDSIPARILEFVKTRSVKLPPLSLAYLAAIFSKKGHEVVFSSNNFVAESNLVLVPVSIVDYKKEIKMIRKIRQKGVKVGVFGTFATSVPSLFVKEANFVIRGEPENAVNEIAKTGKIPSGVVTSGWVDDLDKLPFPKWDIFPISEYSYAPAIKRKNFVTILTSRGCPFSCGHYCPYPLGQGNRWRGRSTKNVITEMEYLFYEFGVRGLDFRDPNFTLDKERAREIARQMIRKKLDFHWSCETHLNVLDEELLKTFYKAGLRNINVGVESADDSVLKLSKRQSAVVEHQKKMICFCHKLGISVAAFYILGLPSDTRESMRHTIEYAKKLNTTVAQFTICTPYPGTKFYEEVKDKIISKNWEDFNAYNPVFKHDGLSREDLLKFKEYAWVSYYFRPSYAFVFLGRLTKDVFNNWLSRFYRH